MVHDSRHCGTGQRGTGGKGPLPRHKPSIEGILKPPSQGGVGLLSLHQIHHARPPKLIIRAFTDLAQAVGLTQDIGQVHQGLTAGRVSLLS